MTCKEVKKVLNHSYLSPAARIPYEVKIHARSCAHCSQELAINSLTNTLVGGFSDFEEPGQSPWDDVRLVNRIKARIRELDGRGMGSWDTSIIAIRGWLLAFGATAVLLLALSGRLATNTSQNEVATDQNGRGANWSEELVSTNSSPNLPSDEDSENAH
jgi:hypothetical protein